MLRPILFSFLFLYGVPAIAQKSERDHLAIEKSLNAVQQKQATLSRELRKLSAASDESRRAIRTLRQNDEALRGSVDSLRRACDSLRHTQETDRTAIDGRLRDTDHKVSANSSIVRVRTRWGGGLAAAFLLILLIVAYYLTRRIRKGASSVDEVRRAQEALQAAHAKMQEEAVGLDNKMVELLDRQISSAPAASAPADHSLALKVADEIVRIETNLSRMDSSIRGYKQLAKAVQRIKDNFHANGYEIVDMLGKPYVAGMKAAVTFVTDESLAQGQQIISKIIKPQINYQQEMIQAAQIEVSQPE